MPWICHNGNFLPEETPVFTAANRGFKYGDGVFETARFYKGRLLLARLHFQRFFSGLQLLQITPWFTEAQLQAVVSELCERNSCTEFARVRMAAYRGTENLAAFVIEAVPLAPEKAAWNKVGWRVTLYPFARKSCDAFANLKSANYLQYLMAAMYATEQGVDESLVLNMHNRICDGSKTNVFVVKENDVFTPALSEGCVAGVMRQAIIDFLKETGNAVHQQGLTEADLLKADYVFVTNAIEGLRWVCQFGDKTYEYGPLKKWHAAFTETLFKP